MQTIIINLKHGVFSSVEGLAGNTENVEVVIRDIHSYHETTTVVLEKSDVELKALKG